MRQSCWTTVKKYLGQIVLDFASFLLINVNLRSGAHMSKKCHFFHWKQNLYLRRILYLENTDVLREHWRIPTFAIFFIPPFRQSALLLSHHFHWYKNLTVIFILLHESQVELLGEKRKINTKIKHEQ